jgi:hypothetical protein
MERFSTSLLAFGLLAGCAAAPPPPMTADNPANPSAPEATVRPLHNTLGTDSLTRKGLSFNSRTCRSRICSGTPRALLGI